MEVSRVTQQSFEIYNRNLDRLADARHTERIVEERRVKYQKQIDEAQRIEMNRRMNRSGQNVDKMA